LSHRNGSKHSGASFEASLGGRLTRSVATSGLIPRDLAGRERRLKGPDTSLSLEANRVMAS